MRSFEDFYKILLALIGGVLLGVVVHACVAGDVDVRQATEKAATETPVPSPTSTEEPEEEDEDDVIEPFELTWNVDVEGDEDERTICLPLIKETADGHSKHYNFKVDWGDGNEDTITDDDIKDDLADDDDKRCHIYEEDEVDCDDGCEVKITLEGDDGKLEAWSFQEVPHSKDKLVEVTNIGEMGWKYLAGAFYGCTALTSFTGEDTEVDGASHVDDVTDMSNMFYGATALENVIDVSEWDTGEVTDMSGMFYGTAALDGTVDLSGWDTGEVTDMSGMFHGLAAVTDLDLSDWDTAEVTTMKDMFYGMTTLDTLTLGDDWVTSAVTDMSGMFQNAAAINPDVSSWRVNEVTDMSRMFAGASAAEPDMSDWTFNANVKMDGMFAGVDIDDGTYGKLLEGISGTACTVSCVLDVGCATLPDDDDDAREDKFELIDSGWVVLDGEACP